MVKAYQENTDDQGLQPYDLTKLNLGQRPLKNDEKVDFKKLKLNTKI